VKYRLYLGVSNHFSLSMVHSSSGHDTENRNFRPLWGITLRRFSQQPVRIIYVDSAQHVGN